MSVCIGIGIIFGKLKIHFIPYRSHARPKPRIIKEYHILNVRTNERTNECKRTNTRISLLILKENITLDPDFYISNKDCLILTVDVSIATIKIVGL